MKAYAKYLGNYESMVYGNVEDTLRDCTGNNNWQGNNLNWISNHSLGTSFERMTTRDELIVTKLTTALDKKYIVLTSMYSELS
jgi:hypothetical protein